VGWDRLVIRWKWCAGCTMVGVKFIWGYSPALAGGGDAQV